MDFSHLLCACLLLSIRQNYQLLTDKLDDITEYSAENHLFSRDLLNNLTS